MQMLRPAPFAARVVHWHNRHPLARRIAADHVVGIGVISLPFALREPGQEGGAVEPPTLKRTLKRRLTPAPTPALTPIFDTDWMYDADQAALYRFVIRHGAYPLHAAAHWPWRHVDADLPLAHAADAQGLEGRTARHVLSAVIEVDGWRSRVLVGASPPLTRAPVFGRRLYAPRRVALGMSTGALAASALAGSVALQMAPSAVETVVIAAAASPPPVGVQTHRDEVVPVAVMPSASASSPDPEAVTDSAAASTSTPVSVSAPASAADAEHPPPVVAAAPQPAVRYAVAPAAEVTTGPPADVPPTLRHAAASGPLVQIRPTLTEDERRQARIEADALRRPPTEALLQGDVFALSTPALRTRDDAQAQQVLLRSLQAQVSTPVPTHLDVMRAGRHWRVVWWPHPRAEDAEQLRREALARGLKLDVIAF